MLVMSHSGDYFGAQWQNGYTMCEPCEFDADKYVCGRCNKVRNHSFESLTKHRFLICLAKEHLFICTRCSDKSPIFFPCCFFLCVKISLVTALEPKQGGLVDLVRLVQGVVSCRM